MKTDIKERFYKVLDNLYKEKKYFSIEGMKLGYPKLSDEIPTAGVAWDKIKKSIIFLFNEDFLNSLNDDELVFVISHEVYHILSGHIFQLLNKIDLYKKNGLEKDIPELSRKMNVAQDCIVNDSLVNLFKFKKYEKISKFEAELCFGKNIVGFDTEDYTSEDIYDLIPEKYYVNNHNWQSFFDKDGKIDKDFIKRLENFIKNNKQNSFFSDEELNYLDKIESDLKDKGLEFSQGKRTINYFDNNLKWERILSNFVEIRKTEDTWNRVNRNTYGIYPEIIIPSVKDQEVQEVFVAVDSSGSIDYTALSLFVSLLKKCPPHIKIKAITFDTRCYEYDVKSDDKPQGGGGTNFQIIENYIIKNFKTYPKCVMILTDGHGTYVGPKYSNRWLWLLYGGYSIDYCKNMKHYSLSDFIL